jgi:hypothetical protein
MSAQEDPNPAATALDKVLNLANELICLANHAHVKFQAYQTSTLMRDP